MPHLKVNNICRKRVDNLKFLGVFLDENLNWQSHIVLILNKILKDIVLLFKAWNYNTSRNNMLENLLLSIFSPFVETKNKNQLFRNISVFCL